jgi:glycine cleavage system pyridoxal-binding protein P
LGNSVENTNEILKTLKVKTIEELMDQTVPENIRLDKSKAFKHKGKELMGIHSETMLLSHLREYAMMNKVFKSY